VIYSLIMQASATLLHILESHTDEVARLSISPDGKTLAAHDDSAITLWDIQTGSLLHKLEEADDMFFGMSFSPDSKLIAAASDEGIGQIWNTQTGELNHAVKSQDERMLSLAFSPDGKMLATGSEVLRIWDTETGELLHTLLSPGDHSLSFTAMYERNEYPGEISEVEFACNGKILVSTCPNKSTVCIWNTETWTLEHTFRGHTACSSPDGRFVAVLEDEDVAMQIYEISTWQLHSTLEDTKQQVFPSTFSDDSKVLATCSIREINLWDVDGGKHIKTFRDPANRVCALAFSPDGKILISGAEKCGLRVWNVESRECLLAFQPEDGLRDPWSGWVRDDPPAFGVLFTDGGAKVAVAFPDGSVRIWDVKWEST